MSGQILAGSFPIFGGASPDQMGNVLLDSRLNTDAAFATYSTGAIRSVAIQGGPSLLEGWTILGWSIRMRAGFMLSSTFPFPNWCKFGDLWAGLTVDTGSLQNGGGTYFPAPGGFLTNVPGSPALPVDLSTFTKIWDTDSAADLLSHSIYVLPSPRVPFDPVTLALIGQTYMLPSPVHARSGSNLSFSLICSRSVIGNGSMGPFVQSCDYSVIYDDGR